MVLVLLAAATLLGANYMSTASLKMQSSLNMASMTRATFVAECGIEHAWCLLAEAPEELTGTELAPQGPYHVDESDDYYTFWVDQSESDSDLYTIWGTGVVGGITRYVGVTVRYSQSYKDMILSHDPRHYWRFNETESGGDQGGGRGNGHGQGQGGPSNQEADDEVGNRDGEYVNGVILEQPGALTGEVGYAVELDGDNDCIECENVTVGGYELTLVAWVRFDEAEGYEVILSRARDQGYQAVFWELGTLADDDERIVTFSLRTQWSVRTIVADDTPLVPNQWHMVAAVYDGTHMSLYLNGQLVSQRSKSGALTQGNNTELWLGRRPGGDGDYAWDGWLDEVTIFSTVLTQTDIQELYERRVPAIEVVQWHD